jgi:hypothetical protein
LGLDSEAAAAPAAGTAAAVTLGVLGFWAAGAAATEVEEAATGAGDEEDCLAILIDGFYELVGLVFYTLSSKVCLSYFDT